ncbi:murein L,D-transpeptidase, partial [Mesorhizobium sp. M7A.F.Ca.US.001.04.1.1]
MRRGLGLLVLTFSTALGAGTATLVISPAHAASLLTPDTVNAAPLDAISPTYAPPDSKIDPLTTGSTFNVGAAAPSTEFTQAPAADAPSPSIVRLQVLLDRAGASPGVID